MNVAKLSLPVDYWEEAGTCHCVRTHSSPQPTYHCDEPLNRPNKVAPGHKSLKMCQSRGQVAPQKGTLHELELLKDLWMMGISLYSDLNNSEGSRPPGMIPRATLLAVPMMRLWPVGCPGLWDEPLCVYPDGLPCQAGDTVPVQTAVGLRGRHIEITRDPQIHTYTDNSGHHNGRQGSTKCSINCRKGLPPTHLWDTR